MTLTGEQRTGMSPAMIEKATFRFMPAAMLANLATGLRTDGSVCAMGEMAHHESGTIAHTRLRPSSLVTDESTPRMRCSATQREPQLRAVG